MRAIKAAAAIRTVRGGVCKIRRITELTLIVILLDRAKKPIAKNGQRITGSALAPTPTVKEESTRRTNE